MVVGLEDFSGAEGVREEDADRAMLAVMVAEVSVLLELSSGVRRRWLWKAEMVVMVLDG